MHSWPIQVSVYNALSADLTLTGMVTGIFDNPEQNQAFPYITLGEDTNTPDDVLINTGSQATLTIHSWSRKRGGMAEVKQIMDRIYFVLHRKALTISGTQAVDCVVEFNETFRDADADTVHGVQRLRIRTFEA